jgi:hypothetical protein
MRKKRTPFTEEEVNRLLQEYPIAKREGTIKELADSMNRPLISIMCKARLLGLTDKKNRPHSLRTILNIRVGRRKQMDRDKCQQEERNK